MKIITDTKQLGNTIRKVRKAQALTQEQLAATSCVGVRFIRELEQGKESCHIGKAIMVTRMLGMSLFIDEGNSTDGGAESSHRLE